MRQAQGKVYKQVLHEYRDRGLSALREADELQAREGTLHRLYRRRRSTPLRRPRLSRESRDILARWRAGAELDVSHPKTEPTLGELDE
jgi:hypothetical protein